jgi:hypothetical protein
MAIRTPVAAPVSSDEQAVGTAATACMSCKSVHVLCAEMTDSVRACTVHCRFHCYLQPCLQLLTLSNRCLAVRVHSLQLSGLPLQRCPQALNETLLCLESAPGKTINQGDRVRPVPRGDNGSEKTLRYLKLRFHFVVDVAAHRVADQLCARCIRQRHQRLSIVRHGRVAMYNHRRAGTTTQRVPASRKHTAGTSRRGSLPGYTHAARQRTATQSCTLTEAGA